MDEMEVVGDGDGLYLSGEVVLGGVVCDLLLQFGCELLSFLWVDFEKEGGGYEIIGELFWGEDVSFHELVQDNFEAGRGFHDLSACL
jgi:hypothetical protein